jgi:DNA-binding NtrC family response regulator
MAGSLTKHRNAGEGLFMGESSAVAVISFASRSSADTLAWMLSRLGWNGCLVEGAAWLTGAALPSAPLLLLVERPDVPASAIVAALERDRVVPALLMLCPELPEWDRGLTALCPQFVSWPCAARELEHRLRDAKRPVRPEADAHDLTQLELIGSAPSFLRAVELLKKIARCDENALIEGETGTGKELAARAMHYLSARRDHPFVALNCGAFPDNLIENELFGHCRGAFTDARQDYRGLIAEAEGGTLFLDEVNSLSPKAQVALLRFLQDRRYRPLGTQKLRDANVRVVAASNVELARLAEVGAFRADLYYRLNVLQMSLPPLRERRQDIDVLSEHFLRQCRARYNQPAKLLHPAALVLLRERPWPGNVRELQHFVHRQYLLCEGRVITLEPSVPESATLAPLDGAHFSEGLSLRQAKQRMILDFELRYLTDLLRQTRGNVTHAAARAGTERRALGKLIKRHKLEAKRFTEES